MKRRAFIQRSALLGTAAAAGVLPRFSFAAPGVDDDSQPATLVVVYLRGGADPINAIVPFGDPLYRDVRPTIAVPLPGADPSSGVIPLNNYFGFHPAMVELAELYRAGMMVPILNAGSTHPTRSHFDAQDFMERAAPGVKSVTEGWLNRYLSATAADKDGDLRAVALQSTLPRSLRGQYAVLATPDGGAEHAMDRFERLYDCDSNETAKRKMSGEPTSAEPATTQARGDGSASAEPASAGVESDMLPEERNRQRILTTGQESIRKLRELNRLLGNGGRDDAGFPRSRLGQQFRQTADLIKSNRGLEVAAFDYNGWDHHAYQGGADGLMADMLGDLSASIAAFAKHLGDRMNKTLVLTMSEFGRTVRENGNAGTDHGRAGYMLAVGGMVNGDRFYGKWTGLDRNQLVDGRDLRVHTDFRRVFAESLAALFGFEADDHQFFPDYRSREKPLGFLKPVAS